MAITQTRMLAILDAATELLENYDQIVARAAEHRKQLAADISQGTSVDILDEFDGLIQTINDLQPSRGAVAALATETAHFNISKKKNDRAREYMAAKRRPREETLDTNEATLPTPREFNLSDLIDYLSTIRLAPGKTINAHQIADRIAKLGEANQIHQATIIRDLISSGILIPDRIGGEYTLRAD